VTGTILDAAERQNPQPWWRRAKHVVSALELAQALLKDCQREQLDHKEKAEFHTAMTELLIKREQRLREDIVRFSIPPHI
jgi:hypothetical protein